MFATTFCLDFCLCSQHTHICTFATASCAQAVVSDNQLAALLTSCRTSLSKLRTLSLSGCTLGPQASAVAARACPNLMALRLSATECAAHPAPAEEEASAVGVAAASGAGLLVSSCGFPADTNTPLDEHWQDDDQQDSLEGAHHSWIPTLGHYWGLPLLEFKNLRSLALNLEPSSNPHAGPSATAASANAFVRRLAERLPQLSCLQLDGYVVNDAGMEVRGILGPV